jgi:hypothetical protein
MRDWEQFSEFRVRPFDRPGYFKTRKFWGKPLAAGEYTMFTGDELRQLGASRLNYWVATWARNVEVEGRSGLGRWRRISGWKRSKGAGFRASEIAEVADEMRAVRATHGGKYPPKLGEMVHHLKDHLGLSDEETLKVLKRAGETVYPRQLAKLRYYGSVRRGECRFCGGSG